jgi:hypothetical protein
MDQAINPSIELTECDTLFAVGKGFAIRIQKCIPIDNVRIGSYVIAAQLFEYQSL